MSVAIIGFVGVVVGAVVSGVANWLVQNSQTSRGTAAAVKAAARLTYDDFLHYQSTLVRALARNGGSWWRASEVLARQSSIEDRKLLLSALADGPSQDVAAAQGWMDYLLGRRTGNEDPSEADLRVMRDTFCRLDRARGHLSGSISGRQYTTFTDGAVLDSIEPPVTLEQLEISALHCEARRAVNYGRGILPPAMPALSGHDPLDEY